MEAEEQEKIQGRPGNEVSSEKLPQNSDHCVPGSLQVASHVQKYFIKLANAGLPVPGRTPNVAKFSRSRKVWLCDKERVSLTM